MISICWVILHFLFYRNHYCAIVHKCFPTLQLVLRTMENVIFICLLNISN